jgi:hypothetical protein
MHRRNSKAYFTSVDIALVGVFCALWAVLNLTLGPLSFSLLQLPILHDFAAFFTLLLVVWATGKFGIASLVGIIGSCVAILLGGPLLIVGFAASGVIFDVLMLANRHRAYSTIRNLTITVLATMISAYFAGAVIGLFFMNGSFQWAVTIWAGLHMAGGIMSAAITLPILASMEKANVRAKRN